MSLTDQLEQRNGRGVLSFEISQSVTPEVPVLGGVSLVACKREPKEKLQQSNAGKKRYIRRERAKNGGEKAQYSGGPGGICRNCPERQWGRRVFGGSSPTQELREMKKNPTGEKCPAAAENEEKQSQHARKPKVTPARIAERGLTSAGCGKGGKKKPRLSG